MNAQKMAKDILDCAPAVQGPSRECLIEAIARQIQAAEREAMEKCRSIEFPVEMADTTDYERGWDNAIGAYRRKIRAFIEQGKE